MLFQQRSLRANFIIKLTILTVVLELIFSSVFYSYINYSVDKDLQESLIKQARYLLSNYKNLDKTIKEEKDILYKTLNTKIKILALPEQDFSSVHFKQYEHKRRFFLEGYFPYEFALQRYLVLTADITKQKRTQQKVIRGIIMITIFGLAGVLLYAFFLSGILTAPIRVFNKKISKINENTLEPIDLKDVPDEFEELGRSVNGLIGRIESFLNYKKELFVGTAHELKTPLAVMKTKSQVALMKKSPNIDDLKDALEQNIKSIDDMNKIVSSILEFGRAEGAQFEKPERVDVVSFLEGLCREFEILATSEHKHIKCHLNPEKYYLKIPTLLLRQIIQNLLQNALKFTPKGKEINMYSYVKGGYFYVKVRDEGEGIDEDMDLFAPFKRSKDSNGAGLGLFLVKSAADALQARIEIKNRIDKKGAVATLAIPIKH